MKKILHKVFTVLVFLSTIVLISCNEDPTPSLYDLPAGNLPAPAISGLNPAEGLAGVTKIIITGSNFSSVLKNNFVYFNGKPGTVLTATPTQLTVTAANIVSDTVLIKVSVLGALDFSNIIIYKLKPAVSEYYTFDAKILKEFPYGICTDNQENVYVSLSGLGTKKILPIVDSLVNFAPKGPETFFRGITFASDNAVYGVRGGIKGVYRAAENTAPAAFVSSAQGITDNVNDVEFDATRNVIWGGGATGILYRIRLDKNVKKFNITGTVNAMRVAGNDLFVATRTTDNEEIVWKVPIINADSLGTPEQYFNVSTSINTALKIGDIVVSEDGDLYIGTDQALDPIYNIHPDKSFETHYPGLIDSPVYSLSWGYGNILYMTNIVAGVNTTILRINMQKPGAH